MTTTTENKALVRRLTAAWNERDRDEMAALYADRLEFPESGETHPKEALIDSEWAFFDAFPDIEATTEELVAEDDTVLVRWRVTGTHEGEYEGIEPTGNTVAYEEWALYRIEDGRIASVRAKQDTLDFYEQLDAADGPPA